MGLKKIVGKVLGIGEHDAEVNDYLASVQKMVGGDEKSLSGRRQSASTGTKSYGERDLIRIGNRLAQKLRAAGDDKNLRRVSNKVFMLGRRVRRR